MTTVFWPPLHRPGGLSMPVAGMNTLPRARWVVVVGAIGTATGVAPAI
jgi:hypothetical protein